MRIHLPREDRLSLPDGRGYAVAKPFNDLLGLRDDDRYTDWLAHEWGSLAPSRATITKLIGPPRKDDASANLRDDLARIAARARKPGGSIDYMRLAPLLSQVRHFESMTDQHVELPSFEVLAAWALERTLRGSDLLVECPTCKRPWFARPLPGKRLAALLEPRYCSRPAPGLTVTCAQLEAADRFARERSEWSKEYRKVMARKLRGTVSEKDFRAWKAVSNPGKRGVDWTPFDEWKAQREENDRG